MKNLMLLFAFVVIGFGCAKKEENTVPVGGQYVYINNICMDQINNIQVNYMLCQNNGYTYVNGNCVQTATNTVVSPMLCQTSGYVYVNGICVQSSTNTQVPNYLCQQGFNQQSQICYGNYYSQAFQRSYFCNGQVGSICSGQYLVNQQTNQSVLCQ